MRFFTRWIAAFLPAILFAYMAAAQAPANDNLCNAVQLTVGASCNGTPNGNNTNSTAQPGEPTATCFAGNANSVWFYFVAPSTGVVRISTDYNIGTNDDTQISLYALPGNNCSNLSSLLPIACDQDGGTVVTFNSIISAAPATPGDTFYIQVSGWNGTIGSFCITVDSVVLNPPPAANDLLCNATPLTVGATCSGTPNGNNTNALFQVGEPLSSCTNNQNSVWFSFVAPPSGFVTVTSNVNVGGTNTATNLSLYALVGGNCNNLSSLFEVGCNNGISGFGSTIDSIPVIPGQTYYVKAVGGSGGTFCVQVSEVTGVVLPANDSLCNAIPLTINANCTSPNGNNTGATAEIGETPASCFVGGTNSVWYSFVAPASGQVRVTTDINLPSVTNTDTEIAIYALPSGNCNNPADLVEIACDQDGGNTIIFNSIIGIAAVNPGQTYYLSVSGWNGEEGAFCIEIDELFLPANDDVCDAIALPVNGTIDTFFNIGATVEPGEGGIAPPVGNGAGNQAWYEDSIKNSVWFTFVAPPSGTVTIDLCNGGTTTDFDTQVAVYEVDSCDNFATFTLVGANDDIVGDCPGPGDPFASILNLTCLQPDSTYYILVDGWQGGADLGFFGISITAVPKDTLNVLVSVQDPDCPGAATGSIDITPVGGGSPYTYLWSNGATTEDLTNVVAGTYTVTITDFCDSTLTLTAKLNNPAPLRAFAGRDTAICIGEEVTLGAEIPAINGKPFSSRRAFAHDLGTGGIFRHRPSTPGVQTVIGNSTRPLFADDDAFGVIFALDNTAQQLVAIDTASGAVTLVGASVPNAGHTWTGLAFNDNTSTMYALSTAGGGNSTLYTIDLGTGAATPVAPVAIPVPIWLAIDTAGNAYSLDIGTDILFSVNLTTGAVAQIGPVGFNASFAQDADFDPETNRLYLAAYNVDNAGGTAELRVANTTSGSTTLIGPFTGRDEVAVFSIFKNTAQPYSYSWTPFIGLSDPFSPNPTSSAPQTTSYVFSVADDCGTIARDTVVVTVSPGITATLSSTPDFGQSQGTAQVNVTAGIPPYTYLWETGATTDSIGGLAAGFYTVTVTDAAGCTKTDSVQVLNRVSIEEIGLTRLNVYPNPTSGALSIELGLQTPGRVEMALFDVAGKVCWEKQVAYMAAGKHEADLSRLPAGVYMLRVRTLLGDTYLRISRQ